MNLHNFLFKKLLTKILFSEIFAGKFLLVNFYFVKLMLSMNELSLFH